MILAPERTHHKPCMDCGIWNPNLQSKFRELENSMQNQPLNQPLRTRSAASQKNSDFWKYPRYFNHLQKGPE